MDTDRFLATFTGKCDTCGGQDTLDAMLRKDAKGVYECKDCAAERYIAEDGVVAVVSKTTIKEEGKLRRLFLWCFG